MKTKNPPPAIQRVLRLAGFTALAGFTLCASLLLAHGFDVRGGGRGFSGEGGFGGGRGPGDGGDQIGIATPGSTVETLGEEVDLKAAASTVTAVGKARLQATMIDGTTGGGIQVGIKDLAAGTYNVGVLVQSGSGTIALGTFTVSGGNPSPTPTPTVSPTATPTPSPTDTPTPVPSATPSPTDTPTPVPSATPSPTDTPTPVPSASPAATLPAHTAIAVLQHHTPTPKPKHTPTPKPKHTPTPKPKHSPTPKPKHSPTPKPARHIESARIPAPKVQPQPVCIAQPQPDSEHRRPPFAMWSCGGDSGNPLPNGLNLFDVTQLVIADTSGNVVMSADFTASGTSGQVCFNACAPIIAGTAAASGTNAAGQVRIWAGSADGTQQGILRIDARSLPGNVSATVNIDGTDVGNVTSGIDGRLVVLFFQGANAVTPMVAPSICASGEGPQFTGGPVVSLANAAGLTADRPVGGGMSGIGGWSVGTLPSTVNLFTVKTITLHFADGTVLFQADM